MLLISELIPDRFEYRQGATYVDSTIEDLLDVGAGVCQDFVHLGLCAAPPPRDRRAICLGLPVRDRTGTAVEESVEVDTHAWLEALLPVLDGGEPVWVGADPTNRGLAGENHVKIGHGRHYADVPPIKGVYRGTAEAELEAQRDDDPARARRPRVDRAVLDVICAAAARNGDRARARAGDGRSRSHPAPWLLHREQQRGAAAARRRYLPRGWHQALLAP